MITYNSIAAMKMNRTLFDLNNKLNSVNKALETGSTVNKPSDNPAVYNLVSNTKNYATLYSSLNEKTQTGISIIDSELQSVSTIQDKLDEIKTLLNQANSDSLSSSQRADIQSQINTLMSEITDTRANTKFNGLELFELKGQYEVSQTNTETWHQLTIDDFTNIQTSTLESLCTHYDEQNYFPYDVYMNYCTSKGATTVNFRSGEKDGKRYYFIETAEQLRVAMNGQLTSSGSPGPKLYSGNFVLLNDIDMSGQGSIDGNCSVMDGNGHTVSNLSRYLCTGNTGTIKNLNIINAQSPLIYINSGTIDNISIKNSNSSDSSGLLCGANSGTIRNCYIIDSTVSGYGQPTLCSYNNRGASISNCYAFNITSTGVSKKFVDTQNGSASNCYQNLNESDTTATYQSTSWFASEAAATALGSAYEFIDDKNHPTLLWENPIKTITTYTLIDNSMRIQTGLDSNDYVTIDTTFYFDDNFSFDASSQANASESLTKLTTLKNQLSEKTEALNTSRKELVKKANYSESKVTAANNIISAWTGFDQDEMLEKKAKIISDITNIHSLQEQLSSINLQMCRSFILGAIINNYNSGSSSLFSPLYSNSFLSNLLST